MWRAAARGGSVSEPGGGWEGEADLDTRGGAAAQCHLSQQPRGGAGEGEGSRFTGPAGSARTQLGAAPPVAS